MLQTMLLTSLKIIAPCRNKKTKKNTLLLDRVSKILALSNKKEKASNLDQIKLLLDWIDSLLDCQLKSDSYLLESGTD